MIHNLCGVIWGEGANCEESFASEAGRSPAAAKQMTTSNLRQAPNYEHSFEAESGAVIGKRSPYQHSIN